VGGGCYYSSEVVMRRICVEGRHGDALVFGGHTHTHTHERIHTGAFLPEVVMRRICMWWASSWATEAPLMLMLNTCKCTTAWGA
jgi:hypothetical protein